MLDIFTQIVAPEKLHPNFKAMMHSSNEHTREVIKSWTEGFIDRDNKIVTEFQTTFNSSFWEFYLNAAFNTLGFNIDYSKQHPDFILEKNGDRIIAEATIANNPADGTPEWDRKLPKTIDPAFWFQLIHLSTIRLSNAIDKKHKKYKSAYMNSENVSGLPFIICLAPFEQPFFFEQSDNAIRRLLYRFSAPLYTKDDKTGEILVVGKEYVDTVTKSSGSDIELGLFTDDRMKEISAIIFSSTATITKVKALASEKFPTTLFHAIRYQSGTWDSPYNIAAIGGEYKETLLDGLHIFLNPFATNKFDPNILYDTAIALHDYDYTTNEPMEFVNDGFLLSHFCFTGIPTGSCEKFITQETEDNYSDYTFKWEHDKLYKLNAIVGPGINNHIAHYNGWTIVVFQDSIDNDWFAFARQKIVFTIQDFLSLGDNYSMKSPPDFYSNINAAYSAIKEAINTNTA